MPIYTTDDEKRYLNQIGENAVNPLLLAPEDKIFLLERYIKTNTEKRKNWGHMSAAAVLNFAETLIAFYKGKVYDRTPPR
jgi:hypothetical protein